MNEFAAHIKHIQTVYFFFLSFCLVCWALWIDARPQFAGVILGITISMINARYLAWKINRITNMALSQNRYNKLNIGFLTRAAIATLAAIIAYQYQQHFHVFYVVGSFFFAFVVGSIIVFIKAKSVS